jgi:hypothetical protein
MLRSGKLFCGICVTLLGLAPVAAQIGKQAIQPIGAYQEFYVANPKVSTALLVGLRWGSLDGSFDPENVRVDLPAELSGKLCVELVSEDGRYEAENLYATDIADKHPVFFAKTDYTAKLQAYPAASMGIVIRRAESCDDDASGGILPAIVTPLHTQALWFNPRQLVVYLNAEPQFVTATLTTLGGAPVAARSGCGLPSGEVEIAFRAVCTIESDKSLLRESLTLHVALKERYATRVQNFLLSTAP